MMVFGRVFSWKGRPPSCFLLCSALHNPVAFQRLSPLEKNVSFSELALGLGLLPCHYL